MIFTQVRPVLRSSVIAALLSMTMADATQAAEAPANRIVGAWTTYLAFLKGGPKDTRGETCDFGFNRDGLVTMFCSGNPAPGYGAWKTTDKPDQIKFTLHEMKVTDSQFAGYVIIEQTVSVSKDGNSLSSVGTATLHNPDGTTPFPTPAQITLSGKRIEP